MDNTYNIKDLDPLKYFLRFKITKNTQGMTLCQRKYCQDLLEQTRLLAAKPTSTPMDPSHNLHCADSPTITDPTKFRSLIGKLVYLTNLRSVISFVVCRLSQHLDAPTDLHMQVVFRIMRYLKNAPALGLFFSSNNNLILEGFSDSDWGACPITRRSTTSFCFYLGTTLI